MTYKPVIFQYNKLLVWLTLTFLLGITIVAIMLLKTLNDSLYLFKYLPFFALISFGLYFSVRVFIPATKNSNAMTIDAEKIQITEASRTIYWQDIEDISYKALATEKRITIKLKGRKAKLRVQSWFIAADDDLIYHTLIKFLNNYNRLANSSVYI